MSWSAIPFPGGHVDGDPIRGSLDEVESVATMFDRMGTAAENIHDMFTRIQDEGDQSDSLRGDFSGKLLEVLDGVAGSLGNLPGVAQSAYEAMNNHRVQLSDLRDAAVTALGRANTRWDALQDATTSLGSAASTNSRLQAQVDELPPAGTDPAADADRGGVEDAAADGQAALAAAQGAVDDAEANLEASRTEWFGLRDDEGELNRVTADALDAIELGDLSDPGWFESLVSSVVDLVMDLTLLDELFTLVEALATGDWAAALWALKEILDVVIMVLAVVALFTPIGPLVLALSVVYFATTVTLYATQWPNPETGETASLLDVGLAALDIIPAGVLARFAPIGALTPPSGVTSAATPPAGAVTPPSGAATPSSGSVPPTGSSTPPAGDGPVVFRPPRDATPEEVRQVRDYVEGSNRALDTGYLSPTGRVSTSGDLRRQASRDAAQERARAEAAGTPYGTDQAGHVPDTTWTGNPRAYEYQRQTSRVNASLGRQSQNYPLGWKPSRFEFEEGPDVP